MGILTIFNNILQSMSVVHFFHLLIVFIFFLQCPNSFQSSGLSPPLIKFIPGILFLKSLKKRFRELEREHMAEQ